MVPVEVKKIDSRKPVIHLHDLRSFCWGRWMKWRKSKYTKVCNNHLCFSRPLQPVHWLVNSCIGCFQQKKIVARMNSCVLATTFASGTFHAVMTFMIVLMVLMKPIVILTSLVCNQYISIYSFIHLSIYAYVHPYIYMHIIFLSVSNLIHYLFLLPDICVVICFDLLLLYLGLL